MAPTFKLSVVVVQAEGLLAADSCGTSDPFVKLRVADLKAKTKVVKRTLAPVWNERFDFDVPRRADNAPLRLALFDHDTLSSNDPLGAVAVGFNHLVQGAPHDAWYNVLPPGSRGGPAGRVRVCLTALDWSPGTAQQPAVGVPVHPPPAYGQQMQMLPAGGNPYAQLGVQPRPQPQPLPLDPLAAKAHQIREVLPHVTEQQARDALMRAGGSVEAATDVLLGGSAQAGPPPPAPAPAPAPPGQQSQRKALLIGINYTGTRAQLRGCLNDVRQMRALLPGLGFPDNPAQMVVLTDDAADPNFRPTRQNITNATRWLVAGARPGDAFFFHFSGHGAQEPDRMGDEADGMNETIVPCDFQTAGQITDDELHQTLVAPLPSGARLTAVMDCCHSGTGLDLALTWSQRRGVWEAEETPAHTAGDVLLFSGCEDDECSMDASAYGQPGGAMTTAFVGAVRHINGAPNYATLLESLRTYMRQSGFRNQRPQLSASQPFDPRQRPFYLVDAMPNQQPFVGRAPGKRRRRRPARAGLMGSPLGMMLGGATGFMLASAAAPMAFAGASVMADGLASGVSGGAGLLGDAFGGVGDLFGGFDF